MTRPLRIFGWGALLVVGVGLGLRLAISAREWFISDDFFFLHMIQEPHWSFREALLPTRPRLIAAYRPIGLDAYFLLNYALYGWNALGYYVSALALQGITAFMLARIALGYGLDLRVACTVSALVLLAAPSTLTSYAVAEHNYICAAAAYTTCLAALLAELRRPRVIRRVGAYAALCLGLLSNEVCATFFAVAWLAAYLQSSADTRWLRLRASLAVTWPYLVITGLYIDFKSSGVPMRQENWFYEVDIGSDMLGNLLGNLAHVHGGYLTLSAVGLIAAWWVWGRARGTFAPLGRGPRAAALVGAAWLLATSLPFAVLALPASRFALLQLPAAALLWGVLLEAALPRVRPAIQSYALLAALILFTPWLRMLHALEAPRGEMFRRAHQVISRELPASASLCVTVICDGPALASSRACETFRSGSFGGALWRAVVPDRLLSVQFTPAAALVDEPEALDCLRYYLTPELALTREPPHLAHASAQ